MKNANRRRQKRIFQVRVEIWQSGGHDERLVQNHPAGKAGDIESLILVLQTLLGAPPRYEQSSLESIFVLSVRVYEHLFYAG